jgi:polyhydroxybutyrate depolymerase
MSATRLLLALPMLVPWMAAPAGANTIETIKLSRPEGQRDVNFVVPDGNVAARKATNRKTPALRPLVILLHGHSGSALQLLGQRHSTAPLSPWLIISDRDGVLLAAPEGARGSDDKQGWNDCRADALGNPHTDDVALVRDIIQHAVGQYHADPSRLYVMGMSNGGFMTFRLATEMPDTFAAAAAVSASMAARSQCAAPSKPLSLMVIAGDADPLVPFGGGDVRIWSTRSRGSALGVEKSVDSWRELAKLPAQPSLVATFGHNELSGATSAKRMTWGTDPKQLQVELIVVRNGGHVEPSPSKRVGALYLTIVGKQNADFEASEEAWAFFRTKTKAH